MKKHFIKYKYEYISVAVLLLAVFTIMVIFFKLWDFDITVPIKYAGGDEAGLLVNAKMFTQQGWCLSTTRLGAPFSGDYYDFTANVMHNFDLVTLKIFAMITGNAAIAFNLEYFSIFIFASLISYFVMRELKITNWIAICGSITFVFSPFVIMRGTEHIVLTTCYFIPLSILLCIWLYEKEDIFCMNRQFFKNKRNWFAILFIILIANNGIAYYPFFTCFLLVVVAISKLIKTKKLRYAGKCMAAIGGIAVCMLINMIPIILYTIKNGPNTAAVVRGGFIESELYGLKLIQLFLPVDGHNLAWLSKIITKYNDSTIFFNENITSYIGIIGSCGCLLLIAVIFLNRKTEVFKRLIILSEMNLMMMLLATGSGIGTIFAFLVSDKIRGYNRISVFIMYVSILGFCLATNSLYERKKNKLILIGGILIASFCLWEQMPAGYVQNYGIIKDAYENDKAFVQNIEASVTEGAMIYQLPFHQYPEEGYENDMGDYSLFIGFVHSEKLRWSYGAIKGREADVWLKNTSEMAIEDLVSYLKENGFEGIYIDRRAYLQEDLSLLEGKLSDLLNCRPSVSDNEKLSFFKF